MTEEQKTIIKKFATDLGIALGAKKETALQKGMQTLQKMDLKVALSLMKAWQTAESKQQGSGAQAILQTILKMQQATANDPTVDSEEDTDSDYLELAPLMAKMGAKLDYIEILNGKCPNGYVAERYQKGGCVKCRKGASLLNNFINPSTLKDRFGNSNVYDNIADSDYSVPESQVKNPIYLPTLISDLNSNNRLTNMFNLNRPLFKPYRSMPTINTNSILNDYPIHEYQHFFPSNIKENPINPTNAEIRNKFRALYKCGGKTEKEFDKGTTKPMFLEGGKPSAAKVLTKNYKYVNGEYLPAYTGWDGTRYTAHVAPNSNDTLFTAFNADAAPHRVNSMYNFAVSESSNPNKINGYNGSPMYMDNLKGYAFNIFSVPFYNSKAFTDPRAGWYNLHRINLPGALKAPKMQPLPVSEAQTLKCGGKTKKKEAGGTINTAWLANTATTNKGKKMIKTDKCGGKTKKH